MKILKFLLWTVLILAAIYLVLCIAGPKEMKGTASLSMKAAPATIIGLVTDFNHYNDWSPWYKLDTTATSTVHGTPGTVGHKMEWNSTHKYVGIGSQTIMEISDNSVKIDLVFNNDSTQLAHGVWQLENNGDSTKVTWGMVPSEMPFFFRGMAMVMGMEKMMNDMFSQGLNAIKPIVEAMPATQAVEFAIEEKPEQWYVGRMFPGINVATTPDEEMHKMFGDAYTAIFANLESLKVAPAGPSLSIAHNFNEKTMVTDLEVAVPVADSLPASKGFTTGKIPAGKSAVYVKNGGYSDLPAAWNAFMGSLMGGGNVMPRWSGYEIYVVGPATEQDSTKWVTHLVQPIQ